VRTAFVAARRLAYCADAHAASDVLPRSDATYR